MHLEVDFSFAYIVSFQFSKPVMFFIIESVRVQDRLLYFIKAIGAFSPVTVRGLIYIYARGFITITRVSHPLHK